MFAALALDVDGTLINNAKVIAPFTQREVCRVVEDNQLALVLASSRMPRSLRNVMTELGALGHIVAYNGAFAQVRVGKTYQTVCDMSLPPEVLQAVLTASTSTDVHMGLFFGDQWVVSALDYWALREARTSQTWPDVIGLPNDFAQRATGPHKIMMRGEAAAVDKVLKPLEHVAPQLDVYRPKGNLVEITAANVSKAEGLAHVLQKLRLSMCEVLAFGDNFNDTDMLAAAGWSVAMFNAPDAVKKAADEVTLSNDEEGVGYMLRKHFPCARADFRS